jgi:cysteine desulfurase family protein (TIGR01976 family)
LHDVNATGKLAPLDVAACRKQFPALARNVGGRPAVYFDGPAGSQVPQSVIDAISRYLIECNANHGGLFTTSQESDRMLATAREAVADLLGTSDPDLVAFGANMTTLTFALSRALSRTWKAGDEIIVTRLDHDANVTPWVLAARDAGATVRHLSVRAGDCTLDLDEFRKLLSPRTRLVAVGCASNAVGTVNPVAEMIELAHQAGALAFLDAVHYAPHRLIDVDGWGCDFLACSAYKFFGPHVGVLWGRRELMESLPAYKLRPAGDMLPDRWMTGTQSHEGIAGTLAAVEYLAELGRSVDPSRAARRAAITSAFAAITAYETELAARLLSGLAELPRFVVWGIPGTARLAERVPTVAIKHAELTARQVAARLAEQGIFVWHGNFYALPLTEALGLEPEGVVRIGLLHYNTIDEVDRLLAALADFD